MAKRTYQLKATGPGTTFDGLFNDCADLEALPLTYKNDWYSTTQILKTGTLPFEKCDVFGEKLEYLFYGRPAYVIAQNRGNRRDNLYFPVCFLLDSNFVDIYGVFPFDSGAYAEGLYDGYIHEKMDINEFLLHPNLPHIMGFIQYFYGDNYRYYTRKVKPIHCSSGNRCELNAYINVLSANGPNEFDARADTIEIITKVPFDLLKAARAVVIPNEFQSANDTKEKIEEMRDAKIEIITYPVMGLGPEQYNGIVYEKVYQYLKEEGLLQRKAL